VIAGRTNTPLPRESPRTPVTRAGNHVFWSNPATGLASEIPHYVSDWFLESHGGVLVNTASASPPSTDTPSSHPNCSGHLWIG
jgi:hypothetical protein